MTKHFVIPDCQIRPGDDTKFLTNIGKYIVAKKPDVVVCIGDFSDMPSLSSYDVGKKSHEGKRYTKDVLATHQAMEALLKPLWEFYKIHKVFCVFIRHNGSQKHLNILQKNFGGWGWTN